MQAEYDIHTAMSHTKN